MPSWLRRYARWLHTRWPAGTVEPLPEIDAHGRCTVPGVTITGDLTGIPLLKFALDSGARAVQAIGPSRSPDDTRLDLAIIGAGVSGMAAAVEAKKKGLRFEIVEGAEAFFTIVNFPRAKPIYTFPHDMTPAGALQVSADVKEPLLEELRAQAARAGITPLAARAERVERRDRALLVHLEGREPLRARRVIVAIGRSGDFRMLGVPGEDLPKVYNRLHDPMDFAGQRSLVVGGGDSAVETAIALAMCGAEVTLVHRGAELSRPKHENLAMLEALMRDPMADVRIERPVSELITTPAGEFEGGRRAGSIRLRLASRVREIRPEAVIVAGEGGADETIPNDVVFVMIGREPPLDFLRRSGFRIAGAWTPARVAGLAAFVLFIAWLDNWKSGGFFDQLWRARGWFPYNLPAILHAASTAIAAAAANPRTLLGTIAISAAGPSFWYTLAYSAVVTIFGFRRIARRRTPYVTAQTLTLMTVQVVPLFLLPEIVLPQLGYHGLLPRALADALFPAVTYGHGREYWRAYGLILAWPLDVYNIFTHQPLWWWIAIGFVQTFVLIPLGIFFFGKGVYCGWICSCGALAETLGDTQRHKMPHGPGWNRLNMAGQVVLAIAFALLFLRIAGWVLPAGNWADALFEPLKERYKWGVDVFLGGVLGFGLYFWYSGRVWCRFFCPLAALMHVYTRFSRFRILSDKKKCISCGRCTAICHQGIDVMSFANKGLPMADPECVRCSACVHTCPTGVLTFGQVAGDGRVISVDALMASPVQMHEGR